MRLSRIITLSCLLAATACAAETDEEDTSETEDPFVERPWSDVLGSSLIEPATRRPVRVRIAHAAPLTHPWTDWMRWGVSRWVNAIRPLPGGSNVSDQVVFVDRDEDITLDVHAGDGRAYYAPGSPLGQQHIELYEGDSRGVKVLVHELGHAFGLGDTYVEGSWHCAPDQPASVMCNADTIDLRADDIRGVRFEYCKRTGRCSAHSFQDSYGGGGGDPYRQTCAASERLVGLYVRSGSFVDSLTPLCENVSTRARRWLGTVGGAGGASARLLACAVGRYVTAIDVRAGDYVDAVAIRCSDGSRSEPAGGTGGSPGSYVCPGGFPAAVGIRGHAGKYVDRIGLSCDTSSGATFSSAAARSLPK